MMLPLVQYVHLIVLLLYLEVANLIHILSGFPLLFVLYNHHYNFELLDALQEIVNVNTSHKKLSLERKSRRSICRSVRMKNS